MPCCESEHSLSQHDRRPAEVRWLFLFLPCAGRLRIQGLTSIQNLPGLNWHSLPPDRRGEHASVIFAVAIFSAKRLWTDMSSPSRPTGCHCRGGKCTLRAISSHRLRHAVDTLNREKAIDWPRFMTLKSRCGPTSLLSMRYGEVGLRLGQNLGGTLPRVDPEWVLSGNCSEYSTAMGCRPQFTFKYAAQVAPHGCLRPPWIAGIPSIRLISDHSNYRASSPLSHRTTERGRYHGAGIDGSPSAQ